MVTITLIVIGVFCLGFAALLATRKRFVLASLGAVLAILCGLLLFWESNVLTGEESAVTPAPTPTAALLSGLIRFAPAATCCTRHSRRKAFVLPASVGDTTLSARSSQANS